MHNRSDEYDIAYSILDSTFVYRIGEIVEPRNGFDSDINLRYGSGIYYFLTEEPAKFWNYKPENGEYKQWHFGGRIYLQYNYKDGKLDGMYKEYTDFRGVVVDKNVTDILAKECYYKDGERDGIYKSYDIYGRIEMILSYKNGKLDGWCEYYCTINKELLRKTLYIDGKRIS